MDTAVAKYWFAGQLPLIADARAEIANMLIADAGICHCSGVCDFVDINIYYEDIDRTINALNTRTWCVRCLCSTPMTAGGSNNYSYAFSYNGHEWVHLNHCVCPWLTNLGKYKTCYDMDVDCGVHGDCRICARRRIADYTNGKRTRFQIPSYVGSTS